MIVLDTSALLYWSQNRSLLTEPASAVIAKAEVIGVSAISIWEIGWKIKMGKLRLPIAADDLYSRLQQVDRVRFIPTTPDIWLRTVALDWEHRDPADRIIVATAMLHGCSLVTSDRAMRQYYSRSVW